MLVRVAVAFFCVVAPASAETLRVEGAAVTDAPFSVAFDAGPVLDGFGSGPVRATSLARDGDAVVAEVAASEGLLGRTFTVRVEPAGDGIVRLSAGASVASFTAAPGEWFTGTGERSHAVDLRGLEVSNYVADGPTRPEDRQYTRPTTPPWGTQERDDDTYYPVPWVLSSRGYGVLIDNDETSSFDLAASDPSRWSASVEADRLSLRVFAGPRPADALTRFTAATGRQPVSDAPWVYGPWVQTGQPNVIPLEEEARIVKTVRDADAPISAIETQMHFLPCGAHRGQEDYERRRTEQSHAAGLAHLAYFNPHLCDSYQPVYGEAVAAGVLQRDAAGAPFSYPAFVVGGGPAGFTEEPIAQFDFTAPATEGFYERLVREAFDQGKDGWMEDFGEYTPPFARSADGTPPEQIHNRYPRDYHCAVQRIAARLGRPVTRHQRSGWTGAARCASIVWGGDPSTLWGFDGLSSAVTQGLTIGMSGVARWGTDIGGYFSFGAGYGDRKPGATEDETLTRELLHRWIEFGAVAAVMRTKRSGIAIPSYARPQVFDPESLPVWRRYTKLHTQLHPYLEAADAEYRRSGLPIMRHGLLTHPGEPAVAGAHDQFLFGPDLLAAPVVAPGERFRRVEVPSGIWVDWWRSVRFDGRDGAFLPLRARKLVGGRRHVLPAPEDELPLLVRAGAVLPLLPEDVDTLAPYGGDGVVRLDQRRDRLTLLAFPRGRSSATFGADGERVRSFRRRRAWVLAVDGARARTYTVRAALSTLRKPLRRVCAVRAGGRALRRSRWRFDRASETLVATVRGTDFRLRAVGCRRLR